VAALLGLLWGAAAAVAQPRARVRFDHAVADDAGRGSCGDADAIKAGVAARLGYEPFDDAAPDRLKVVVRRAGRNLTASIELVGADGDLKAERRLGSRIGDCAELLAALELAISIAIDPVHARAQGPAPLEAAAPAAPAAAPPAEVEVERPVPPAATPASSVVIPASAPAAPPPPAPPGKPLSARIAAGVVGGVGSAPHRTIGAIGRAGLRRGDLSLALEGRADLPASVPLRVGEVRTSLLGAGLVPCVHLRFLGACVPVTAGALRAAGHGIENSRKVTVFHLTIGVRLALAVPLSSRLSLVVQADVAAPLTEIELRVDGKELWTTPALSSALGLGLEARIP
jgi:hypothetical protein